MPTTPAPRFLHYAVAYVKTYGDGLCSCGEPYPLYPGLIPSQPNAMVLSEHIKLANSK